MVLRPDNQTLKTPESLKDWGLARAAERGIDLTGVL